MLVLIIEARRFRRRTLELTTTLHCVQGYQHELLVTQTIPHHSAASVGGVVPHDRAVLVQPQPARGAAATVQRARGIHGEIARACLQVANIPAQFLLKLLTVDKFAFDRAGWFPSRAACYALSYSTCYAYH